MLCAGLSLSLFFGACKTRDDSGPTISPKGDAPAWGPTMHDEMLTVIEQFDAFKVPPLNTLTPAQARGYQTVFDAHAMVAERYGLSGPLATADTFGRDIPSDGGFVHARFYKPGTGSGPFPAIVYFHGGAFVIGSITTYDGTTRSLAEQTRAMVVSIGYRLGPENKFPTAHNDAYTAYKWIIQNAATLGIDPARIAVAGEDAGANLACNVSIAARKDKIKIPNYQLLIQPITEATMNTSSYTTYANAEPLNAAIMSWAFKNYLNHDSERVDPRIALGNANLAGLPPTYIFNAEIDPLLVDGEQLQLNMQTAGSPVQRRIFDGVTHDFYGMGAVVPQARDAQGVASQVLTTALQ
jgi:acetyl esterase/lipase